MIMSANGGKNLPATGKPSIAVMAFDNLNNDPSQDYLSDGLSENILTALSRFSDFFVIARNSTFSYKDMPAEPQQIAQEDRDRGGHQSLSSRPVRAMNTFCRLGF